MHLSVIAAVLCFLIGSATVIAIELLRPTLSSVGTLAALSGRPVLGTVSFSKTPQWVKAHRKDQYLWVGTVVLLAAFGIFNDNLQWTAIFAPLVLLPLVILTLGLAWMLASLGVFLRDVGQTIGIITTIVMFLAPVFYPVTAIPEEFRPWIMANPLTFIIEQARDVLIWGHLPDWTGLVIYTLGAAAIAWAGYAWFQKTRKGFADVL